MLINTIHSKLTAITYDVYLQPGESLALPTDLTSIVGPGHWLVSIRPVNNGEELARDHSFRVLA